jgi:hypothetical protein
VKLVIMLNPESIGCRYRRHHDKASVKLMAKADGYVMVRYSRCIPFVVSIKELREKYDPIPTPALKSTVKWTARFHRTKP